MRPSLRTRLLFCSLATIAAAVPAVASAQAASSGEGKNEIIVTAQRRAEKLENVPMSVTALPAASLEKSGIVGLRDIGQVASGVQFNNAGAATQPAIRGVSTILNTYGYENNVAIYVDGIYQPDFLTINSDLANIAGIQVLKGPQGTLYGRNATGGAILITTQAPSDTLTGKLEAGYGSYNNRQISGYVSGPLTSNIKASIAGYWRKQDSYLHLITPVPTGQQYPTKIPGIEQRSVRAKLEIDATSNFKATLGFNYGLSSDPRAYIFTPLDHGNPANYITGSIPSTDPYAKAFNYYINPEATTYEGTLKLELKTGIGTLTSYSAYGRRFAHQEFDLDGSYNTTANGFAKTLQRSDTYQESIDYVIDAIKDFTLVAGGSFYADESGTAPPFYTSGYSVATDGSLKPADFTFSTVMHSKAYSGYLDGTWQATDRLSLSAGARYSHETKTYIFQNILAGTGLRKSATFSKLTPRASIRYEVAPRTNVYASYTMGFRSGTINIGTTATDIQPVLPEQINAYEVGLKTAQDNFRFNIAAFYYDYKDLQVSLTRTFCISGAATCDPSGQATTGLVSNAKKAEIYGIDGDISFNPTENLTIRAGGAWLHARYTDFANANNTSVDASGRNATEVLSWTGLQMPRSPTFSANFGIDYKTPLAGGQLNLTSNLSYTDSFVVQNPSVYGTLSTPPAGITSRTQRFRQSAYALVNAQAQWTDPSEHYSITVYGRNLTDKNYRMTFNGTRGSGDYSTPNTPREFGVKLGYKF